MLWDPFSAISDGLKTAYDQLIVLFEWLIFNPRSLQSTPLGEFLAGNAIGAAPLLSGIVFGTLIILALFAARFRLGFVKSALVFIVVVALSPLWYEIVATLEELGDSLSLVVRDLFARPEYTESGILPTLNAIDAFWGVVIFGLACMFGVNLVFMFVLYEWVTVLTAFLGLLSLALIALGERSRKVFLVLVSIGLVTMALGRPVAMLILESGRAFAGLLIDAPNTIAITGVVTVGSLGLALLAQFILFFLMYQAVSAVSGRVAAVVTGTVKSISKNTLNETQKSAVNANIKSIKNQPEVIRRTKDYSGAVKDGIVSAGAVNAAKMLTARAAASTTPVGAGVATVASVVVAKAPALINRSKGK